VTPTLHRKHTAAKLQAEQQVRLEAAVQLPAGQLDTVERVLEAVQRVIELGGDADWTSKQLQLLRGRTDGLPFEDAFSVHYTIASLLASM
jgi:hypothetical protein